MQTLKKKDINKYKGKIENKEEVEIDESHLFNGNS